MCGPFVEMTFIKPASCIIGRSQFAWITGAFLLFLIADRWTTFAYTQGNLRWTDNLTYARIRIPRETVDIQKHLLQYFRSPLL